MKKSILVLVTLLVLGTLLMGCSGGAKATEAAEVAAPVGEEIFKVTGNITVKNSGDNYVFDEALLTDASTELTYNDPWMGDGLSYKGILLSKLAEIVKPGDGATTLSLVATDGKALDIPISDAEKYDIMLVHWAGGEVLDTDTGGPVKVAIPDDAKGTYVDDQWMWWIIEVKVK